MEPIFAQLETAHFDRLLADWERHEDEVIEDDEQEWTLADELIEADSFDY